MCSLLFSWCSVLTPKRRGFPSLIWPKRVCAAEPGMVFEISSLTQCIQFPLFSVLNRVSSLTGILIKEFEGWQRTVYIVVNSFLIPWSLLTTIRYSVSKTK